MKYFIITIDTEGDNLWDHKIDEPIKTQNVRSIPRFQLLCEKYNFKPVYLVNYEIANDCFFLDFAKDLLKKKQCEIGIHLHAWNNPPYYELQKSNNSYGLPYLIEFPKQIMQEKFTVLYEILKNNLNTEIFSHRSGRWAMNQDYFDILINNNIKTDCSVTPHYSWGKAYGFSLGSTGSDYTMHPENSYFISHSLKTNKALLEVPVTIRTLHRPYPISLSPRKLLSQIKSIVIGRPVWLRPKNDNLKDMLFLVDYINKSDTEYLMFMLHSSELMPGGSPNFQTEKSIECLYSNLEILFNKISKDFTGIMLKDYAAIFLHEQ
jgi:hypothetical protein